MLPLASSGSERPEHAPETTEPGAGSARARHVILTSSPRRGGRRPPVRSGENQKSPAPDKSALTKRQVWRQAHPMPRAQRARSGSSPTSGRTSLLGPAATRRAPREPSERDAPPPGWAVGQRAKGVDRRGAIIQCVVHHGADDRERRERNAPLSVLPSRPRLVGDVQQIRELAGAHRERVAHEPKRGAARPQDALRSDHQRKTPPGRGVDPLEPAALARPPLDARAEYTPVEGYLERDLLLDDGRATAAALRHDHPGTARAVTSGEWAMRLLTRGCG